MAESSPPRDSKKGKAIVFRKEPRDVPEEQVPFSLRVLEEKLLTEYKPPAIGEYDGSKDPEDHLRKVWNAVLLHQYNNAIKCRVFVNTLSDLAQKWFDGLSNESITCFQDFKTVFLHYFVAQDVPSAISEILVSYFSHGLVEGEFFRALIRETVRNFDEMLGRAASYINVEEAQAARRKADKAPAPANKSEKRSPQPPAQPFPRSKDARTGFSDQDSRTVQQAKAVQDPRPGQWGLRYCTYYRSHTYSTADYVQFAHDSRCAVELGLPPPEIAPKLQRLLAGQPATTENRGNVTIREIGMISRGPTNGDSTRDRKSHERRLKIHVVGCNREQDAGPVISFGPQDLEGFELPHDDALIFKVVIANSRVARVFVDTRSSVNVLFKNAFKGMQINSSELQPVATSLYGFTGNEVRPMGQIKLAISLGSEPLVRTRRSTFIVVDSPSSYNVILGRLTLHEFQAAVSIFYQKIKFLVGDQVGEVKGEQLVSHRCYIYMVKVEARKAQRT
ncbi:uncharacterized protein LOC122048116 [Zingiber officinale]|uniref:uncharacterized protein LOC122048116 n=1 Tax=Zingiber officinale TaxID=94328 RepID=UPI001C4B2FBC|nr:uncharacterized protein LOC122048116 [Zingiber officinale]